MNLNFFFLKKDMNLIQERRNDVIIDMVTGPKNEKETMEEEFNWFVAAFGNDDSLDPNFSIGTFLKDQETVDMVNQRYETRKNEIFTESTPILDLNTLVHGDH